MYYSIFFYKIKIFWTEPQIFNPLLPKYAIWRSKVYFPKFLSKIELFNKRAFCQFLNFLNRSNHSKVIAKIKSYSINQTVNFLYFGKKYLFFILHINLGCQRVKFYIEVYIDIRGYKLQSTIFFGMNNGIQN